METLPRRKRTQGHNIIRSQEPDIFPEGAETEPSTSTMGIVSHQIQYQVDARTWIQNGPI